MTELQNLREAQNAVVPKPWAADGNAAFKMVACLQQAPLSPGINSTWWHVTSEARWGWLAVLMGGRCGVTVKMLQTAGNLAWLVGHTVLRNEMGGGQLALSTHK